MSRSRDIATFLGKTEISNTSNIALASIEDAAGLEVYATLDDLPTSGLTSGDQAYVTASNRIYVSNGSGWYNVALINATPALTIDPTGTIVLATDGSTPTFITLTATDSDNPIAALTYSVESDGNFAGLGTITQNIYDPEYNNGAIIDVTGNGSDFFKREVTTNGVRIMGAGTVGGQTAVPDAWLEKVARTFELFTDPDGGGINETSQRELIQNLSGDAGTYHAGFPTIQRVARGAGADYTPNFLTDSGISYWNLTNLFDNTVQNDMVWYLNSTGSGYGDGDNDAQEVIEHAFHTLHMHGLDAQSLKMYPSISSDWATGPLYNAMVEAYDAGKWDPSGYNSPANAFKTDSSAFEVAAKEYLFLLNFCMFEYSSLWEGGSLAPEWTDDMRTQAGIQANNPLGYALHNTYIAPVISKPSLATIRSIFQDGNTPAQDDPSLAGASGYVVSPSNASFTITPLSEDSATTETSTLTFKASDGISFGSGTRTFTLTFAAQITQNSKYTTLLAKADTAGTDNQVDASTNAFTITEAGNVTSTALSPHYPGGYSIYLDGTDDYLGIDAGYLTSNGSWWNSTGFTLETWFYKTASTGAGASVIFDNRQSASNGMLFQYLADGYTLYSNGGYQFQSVGTEKINQWVHLALVISGTSLTLYEDGTSIHTDTVASTASYQYFGRSQNTIGAIQYTPRGANVEFPGYFYDFRISVGSRYTTAFTPPTEPHVNDSDTVLLMGSSPMLIDKSSNNHTITSFGNTSTKRFGPYDYIPYTKTDHGGSVYFDGASDYLSFTMTSDFTFAGDFTLECWFKPNSITLDTQHPNIIILGSYQLYVNSSSNFVGISPDGLSVTLQSASQSINIDNWYHVAVVRSGTSEAMFLNGVRVDTNTASTNYGASSGTSFIGSYNGTGGDFNGYIADLRFVNGTAVYDPSQTTISTPIAPLTAITNTKLLTCTNKNDIWDAGTGKRITKAGNTTASNTQRKFTTSSAVYFDGTGDYIALSANSTLAPGSGSFTIEFWMYATSITGTQNIYDTRTGNGFTVNMASGVLGFYSEPNSGYLLQSSTLSTNTWYHVAIVRNGTAMAMYINGISVATATNSSSFSNTAGTIGARYSQDQQYYFGYLQDLRITKGLARYTSNFTPPTAEFSG